MGSKILSIPKFNLIPQFTRGASYQVHVPWSYLHSWCSDMERDEDPEFQRAHVWKPVQQVRYVEFVLRGGKSSKDIYWNCKGWMKRAMGDYPLVLVDGKQRLHAVKRFMNNEIRVFGYRFRDFIDKLPLDAAFIMHVNDLETYEEVLQWYLDLNSGGVAHTSAEIKKVEDMLARERERNIKWSKF